MLPAPRSFIVNKRAVNRIARTNNTTKRFFRPGRWPSFTYLPGLDFYYVTIGSSTNNKREANRLRNALMRRRIQNYNTIHAAATLAVATRKNALTNLTNMFYNAIIGNRMRPTTPNRSPPKRARMN